MRKEFEINGHIEVQPEITEDEFFNIFTDFLQSKGWYFGGGMAEFQDGHRILPNGETHKSLDQEKVRVIKISKQALFEFIYENFIDGQDDFFEVDGLEVTDTFDMNFERDEFIFCVHKAEDENDNLMKLPEEIDLQQLMRNIPDTTSTMFADHRYKEYTKEELTELSKG